MLNLNVIPAFSVKNMTELNKALNSYVHEGAVHVATCDPYKAESFIGEFKSKCRKLENKVDVDFSLYCHLKFLWLCLRKDGLQRLSPKERMQLSEQGLFRTISKLSSI